MKKITRALSICFALILLVGCGAKPTSFVATINQADGSVSTMHFEGMGDKAQTLTQTTTIDVSSFGEEELSAMEGLLDDSKAEMQELIGDAKGATHEMFIDGTSLVEIMTIDLTDSTSLDKLSTSGVLPLEGSTSAISMKASKAGLEAAGYTITEE